MSGCGTAALRILALPADRPIVYLCADELAAETLAATVAALASDRPVLYLPSSDRLPSDDAPASPANAGRRLAALGRLRALGKDAAARGLIVVASGEAAAQRYHPPEIFDQAPPYYAAGQAIEPTAFLALAEELGYVADDVVDEAGEVGVRGQVIDIFPADAGEPVRIEFRNGAITSLHHYDPLSQLTTHEIDGISIGRARESGGTPTSTLLDHIEPGTLVTSDKAEQRRARFIALARETAGDAPLDATDEAAWRKAAGKWTVEPMEIDGIEGVPRFVEDRRPAKALRTYVAAAAADSLRCAIMGSARDLRFVGAGLRGDRSLTAAPIPDLAALAELPEGAIGLVEGPLDSGARSDRLVLIACADILGSRAQTDLGGGLSVSAGALDFLAAEPGDVVIHEDHGVGELLGLVDDPAGNGELIALRYARDGKRLVPILDAGKIWRYGGEADAVSLDTLNGTSWPKRKAAVSEAVAQTARDLVAIAEKRDALEAPEIVPDTAQYERFVARFPFNETADQARAVNDVRADLASGRPMERLVIGDVGFGKTEVALRAAAMAALAGFQVILAAPTTVLAKQHLRDFERRFADSGIAVEGLFGVTAAAEKRRIAALVAAGDPCIVIGTAAVAGKAITYPNLGLVIVDEEQRFGAADKAKLRGHPDKHLLIMSATPIPRTLHRSLVGLQAMSVIATPPARRQPIRTALKTGLDDGVVTALVREKLRRGQSFVVVPRISDIAKVADELARLVPNQTIAIAHGKLPAAELDQVMVDFADGKGDILLATNIIETGLNIPRANTMIVWNADRFGLAQLHQLRGRVGRGRRRGTVILLSPGDSLTPRSRKRLETLAHHGQLGAGMAIAAADLDQRGGGDVMSEAQSGHMKLIGIELYQHLIEGALRAAKGLPDQPPPVGIRLTDSGTIPADWVPDATVRLNLYLRLSRFSETSQIDDFATELTDRFGELPEPVVTLLAVRMLAINARQAGIDTLTLGPGGCAVTCRKDAVDTIERAGFKPAKERWLLKADDKAPIGPADVVDALELAT